MDCKLPTNSAGTSEEDRSWANWLSSRWHRCCVSASSWRRRCIPSPSRHVRWCTTSTRSTSKAALWPSICWSFSINAWRSSEGAALVVAEAVVLHLGTSEKRGKVVDGVIGVNSFNKLRLGCGGSGTNSVNRPPNTGSRSGPGEVTGGNIGEPRMEGELDSITDNVGVERAVNAGETAGEASRVDDGEVSMTMGECPWKGIGVWGFRIGVAGMTDGDELDSFPRTSATRDGVSSTTTLWSSLCGAWGVPGKGPGRQEGTTRLDGPALGFWSQRGIARDTIGRGTGWEGGATRLDVPGVGVPGSLRILCTCTSKLPLLSCGRLPIGLWTGRTGGRQSPGSVRCLFLTNSANRGRVLSAKL